MYSYIKGKIISIGEGYICLECGNIGYDIFVSNNTLSSYAVGNMAQIFTYMQVSDDGVKLYGFATNEEKNMFLKLITISGVGAKLAISILSGIDAKGLANAILTNDTALLSTIKGIGKKTASRIVLELKEKIENDDMDALAGDTNVGYINNDMVSDAVLALEALGYNRAEAYRVVNSVAKANDSVEDIIKSALRGLNR